ncbi:CE1759 family FMN reductase [Naumannella cuiyingiana]|uniref:FMN reductase n=1 Tax=Naumannella cuiyingiana TaxID=1347891 RepID=A0A7Z0ILL0_9ACTN|nr:CE1759 family FMN reductase [Naumannella cuiyingiana]NYI71735.1 FMN reductase [Naumannella cuiyingiana]
MKVAVITAGTGSPSSTKLLGDRLGEALLEQTDAELIKIDLREYARDLAGHLVTHVPTPELDQAMADVAGADAVIAVSPIFNGSYHGLFKMFFDALELGTLKDTPTLLAATGGSARHSLAIQNSMLPLFYYLGARVTPTAVFAASADWGDASSELPGRIRRAAGELAQLVDHEPIRERRDEFADVTPFEELLRRA